jgi:RHS repeat-associated protein
MLLSERWRGYGLQGWSRGRWFLVGVTSRVAYLAVVVVGTLALLPAGASAEPVCTDTWSGPSEGTWQTATNWSTGKVPTSTDVACIGAGKTVKVTEGTGQAGVVQGEGALVISGSLEVASALEASKIKSLTVEGESAVLTGPATVSVSGSFLLDSGTMSGSGKTVILPGATGSFGATGTHKQLVERTLVNEGTTTFAQGQIRMSQGAVIRNVGTFLANSQAIEFPQIKFTPEVGPTPLIVNTGTFKKTEGALTTTIGVAIENHGSVQATGGFLAFTRGGSSNSAGEWTGSEGFAVEFSEGTFALSASTLTGTIKVQGGTVSAEGPTDHSVNLFVLGGTMSVASGSMSVETLTMENESDVLTGAGTLSVSGSLTWPDGTMSGSGTTVLLPGATASLGTQVTHKQLVERTFVNEGTTSFAQGQLRMSQGAVIRNRGTFIANSQSESPQFAFQPEAGATPLIVNTGTFEKMEGGGTTTIAVLFENLGMIKVLSGKFEFTKPVAAAASTQYGGPENPSAPGQPHPTCGDPVSCATGNFSEAQTDLSVGGRGVGLNLTRYYNSQAGAEGAKSVFGYGWTSSFSDHLVVNKTSKVTTLYQANGSTVPFTEGTGGSFTAPAWTQDTLSGTEAAGYTVTLANQTKYKFAGSSGRLESVTDRDGNVTTLTYSGSGRLETITDPTSRKITLAYNSEGLVESAKDPLGHTVKYTYEGGNLKSVTQPAEAGLRWQFKYDGSHGITEMTDGRGGKTINEYNGSHQVTLQKDPAGHELSFEYEAFHTKITNKTTGSVTDEHFTSSDEPFSITRGFGTSSAATESFTYNEGGYVTSVADGNEHTTKYGYDGASNRTSMVDPNKNETKWTYDSTHDVETMTTPKGETTTIKREAHGNPETIERPAPESKTQITKYKYKTTGELESVEDPLKRVWKYEYDTHGNRTVEVDPATDKRTWEYNEDSQETATVSPRGNVTGGKPTEFTTKIERDNQGRPLKITDPLTHTTKYTYDGDGNVETVVDGNSHTTKYTYNADNQPIKVKEPSGIVTETEYDGAGQVVSQTDGNKNTTKYKRNPVEEVTEVTDPLGRVTKKEYDAAGNLKTLEDPAKRTTTYKYDPANRLEEVSYSDGKTHAVKYEYDTDGDRTSMVDGTGTGKYTYDQLDRLTETENGHKEKIKYEYDLANQQTKITYPNGKAVTRAFDQAGRLEKVTDWLEHTTKFAYNPDSGPQTTTFPSGTGEEDSYAYNNADQMTEAKMLKGTETLASLVYSRDADGQVKTTTAKGLPGEEETSYTYDENNRLTKAGTTEYKYDAANNPTKIGTKEYTYDGADEITNNFYGYNELGERTSHTIPGTNVRTSYEYDQAGNLTAIAIHGLTETKTSFSYDGDSLRASDTSSSGTTSYLAWDVTGRLPLLLNDGANSYIYGPNDLPIEQVSSEGTVLYFHHDQTGSTRMLTSSTGATEATLTYDAYGSRTGTTGTATTPFGYDGQYGNYLRARIYDSATAQLFSVDPMVGITRAPYTYANDNPLNYEDPSGLSSWNPFSESFWTEGNFISESPLNPVPYFEQEISSYENGCGYLASVTHGLEGVVAGAALFAGGEGADEVELVVGDVLKSKLGSITRAPLPPGSPSWAEVSNMTVAEVRAAAKANEPGFKTILKLLTEGKYNKP